MAQGSKKSATASRQTDQRDRHCEQSRQRRQVGPGQGVPGAELGKGKWIGIFFSFSRKNGEQGEGKL